MSVIGLGAWGPVVLIQPLPCPVLIFLCLSLYDLKRRVDDSAVSNG